MFLSNEIVVAAVGGVLAITGTVAGGCIATISSRRSQRRQLLNDAYANVMTEYILYFTTEASYPPSKLLSAIEIAWLLSPKSTASTLRQLESAVIQKEPDRILCGKLFGKFRSSAKKLCQ